MLKSLLHRMNKRSSARPSNIKLRRADSNSSRDDSHLVLEPLEERRLLAVYAVTDDADDGSANTFRWAIEQANASVGKDTIRVDLVPGTSIVVDPTLGPLPQITESVVIEGNQVRIDGGDFGVSNAEVGLHVGGIETRVEQLIFDTFGTGVLVTGADTKLFELEINDVTGIGVHIRADSVTVDESEITNTGSHAISIEPLTGLSSDTVEKTKIGSNTISNAGKSGVFIGANVTDTTISDNLISGVAEDGIQIAEQALGRDFDDLTTELKGFLSSNSEFPGLGMIVYKDGQPVYRRFLEDYTEDTVINLASGSKLLSAATFMSLVDDGTIGGDLELEPELGEEPLSDREVIEARLGQSVAEYVSSFHDSNSNDSRKDDITLEQLWSHTSGLPAIDVLGEGTDEVGVSISLNTQLTLAESAAEIGTSARLESDPGGRFGYGGVSMQVGGNVAEIAAGKSWIELFHERIAGPLGMSSATHYGQNQDYSLFDISADPTADVSNPRIAGGAVTTLDDYGKLLEMLLGRGEFRGEQILSPEAVEAMFTNRREDTNQDPNLDDSVPPPIGFNPADPDQVPLDFDRGYGLGAWLDVVTVDPATGAEVASQASDPGAFGFWPWIDFETGYYGIFMVDATDGFSGLGAAAEAAALVSSGLVLDTVEGVDGLQDIINTQLATPTLDGDVNRDGIVDTTDKNKVTTSKDNALTDATWGDGDLNGDGLVTQADVDIVDFALNRSTIFTGNSISNVGDGFDFVAGGAAGTFDFDVTASGAPVSVTLDGTFTGEANAEYDIEFYAYEKGLHSSPTLLEAYALEGQTSNGSGVISFSGGSAIVLSASDSSTFEDYLFFAVATKTEDVANTASYSEPQHHDPLVVTTVRDDSGSPIFGSLRYALGEVNTAGSGTVEVEVVGSRISKLDAALPSVTGSLVLDAEGLQLDGSQVLATNVGIDFASTSAKSHTVSNLALYDFDSGIVVGSNDTLLLSGSYIGWDGAANEPGITGVGIKLSSPGNTLDHVSVRGTGGVGVSIENVASTEIRDSEVANTGGHGIEDTSTTSTTTLPRTLVYDVAAGKKLFENSLALDWDYTVVLETSNPDGTRVAGSVSGLEVSTVYDLSIFAQDSAGNAPVLLTSVFGVSSDGSGVINFSELISGDYSASTVTMTATEGTNANWVVTSEFGDQTPIASITGPSLGVGNHGVRGQTLEFTLSAIDPGEDQDSGFEYIVDWGDAPLTSITAFTDAGGGVVTVTSAGHGLDNTDTAEIWGTTDYDGTYTVSNVTTDTFDITATFTSTQTGAWRDPDGALETFSSAAAEIVVTHVYLQTSDEYDAGLGEFTAGFDIQVSVTDNSTQTSAVVTDADRDIQFFEIQTIGSEEVLVIGGTNTSTDDIDISTVSTNVEVNFDGGLPEIDEASSGFDRIEVYLQAGADTLDASGLSSDSLTVYGGAGSDTLTGGSGDDQFYGESGDDSIVGGGGTDSVIQEVDANQTLTDTSLSGQGMDSLSSIEKARLIGGDSNNTINAASFTGDVTIIGGSGNDTLTAGSGDDSLVGEAGNDSLVAGGGDDTLVGGTGNDTLSGATGDDSYQFSRLENENLGRDFIADEDNDANGLADELDFTEFGAPIRVNLIGLGDTIIPNTFVLYDPGKLELTYTQLVNLDNTKSIEVVRGTPFNDVIGGNSRNNALYGGYGADFLLDFAGNDTLEGGEGADILEGGKDDDSLVGGRGNDTYRFSRNFDTDDLGEDEIIEGTGNENDVLDTLSFKDFKEAVNVNTGTTSTVVVVTSELSYSLSGDSVIEGVQGSDVATIDSLSGSNGRDTIIGNARDNIIQGFDGDDSIMAGDGNDVIFGGDGDDSISGEGGSDAIDGEAGDDTIDGGSDNDELIGGGESDSIVGGSGTDTVSQIADATHVLIDTLLTGQGNDTLSGIEQAILIGGDSANLIDADGFTLGAVDLRGGAGNDTLYGGSGSDSLQGGGGDDSLRGNAGDDVLQGGAGDDVYDFARDQVTDDLGSDTITESITSNDALDSLDFSGFDEAVTVDLSGDDTVPAVSHGDLTVTLTAKQGLERVVGTTGNDTITGHALDNVLIGGAGADTIDGADGNDSIQGDAGADSLVGGAGTDTLSGGADDDTLSGGAGDDVYDFTRALVSDNLGSDTVTESTSSNDAQDSLDFSAFGEAVTVNIANATAMSLASKLTVSLTNTTGVESIVGTPFADTITGNTRDNLLMGGAAGDTIDGAGGDDTLQGETGSDSLIGGTGTDTVFQVVDANQTLTDTSLVSGADTDTLSGVEHADLVGGDGANTLDASGFTLGSVSLDGAGGSDTLSGGSGNDQLIGGEGDDSLNGNGGTDTVLQITDAAVQDLVDTLLTGQGSDTLTSIERADLTGGDSDNFVRASAFTLGPVVISGGDGDDTLFGSAGNDTIDGGAGDDIILGLAGNDSLLGGGGDDAIGGEAFGGTVSSSGNDTIQGGDGDDVILGEGGNDLMQGGSGEDYLSGGEGNDTLEGDSGFDILVGDEGDDNLEGASGDDTYFYTHTGTENLGSDTIAELTGSDNDAADGLQFEGFSSGVNVDLNSTAAQAVYTNLTITLNSNVSLEVVVGGSGNDTISGNGRDNLLGGRAGNDEISGNSGSDLLNGGLGDDSLTGGTGSDTYQFYRESSEDLGSDTLTEGTGGSNDPADKLDLSDFGAAVSIDLSLTTLQAIHANLDLTLNAGDAFENIVGSVGDDTITGNSRNNLLEGGAGNDSIDAGSGNDTLSGGVGNDSLDGEGGTDRLYEQADEDMTLDDSSLSGLGNDTLVSMEEAELTGGNSDNGLSAASFTGAAILSGGRGNDSITGGTGTDSILGGKGDDFLQGGGGNDTLLGGEGADILIGGTENDSLIGGAGNDGYLFLRAGSEDLGDDTIEEEVTENDSFDSLDFSLFGAGIDISLKEAGAQDVHADLNLTLQNATVIEGLIGTSLNDIVVGNSRSNVLFGGGGDDSLSGDDGTDLIFGDAGNDTLEGGAGDDFIIGYTGNDSLAGGAGNDTYYFSREGAEDLGSDTVTESTSSNDSFDVLSFFGFGEAITLDLTNSTAVSMPGDLVLTLTNTEGIEGVIGSAFGDTITGNNRDNIFDGGAGSDSISGGAGRDIITGGIGADTLDGGADDDLLIAGYLEFGGDAIPELTDILTEWTSGNAYQTRVDNILAGAPDPTPISTNSQINPGTTVFDDVDIDSLIGGTGDDWFLVDTDEDITDQLGSEVETEIDF